MEVIYIRTAHITQISDTVYELTYGNEIFHLTYEQLEFFIKMFRIELSPDDINRYFSNSVNDN